MSPENKKSQLFILFMTVFIYLVGFGIIIPIIPILSRDFGATATQSGLLMSIFSLMQFIFAPFWGRLSDRIGRRPVLIFCLLCEGFCYILFAYAGDLFTLFLARGLAGFFGASLSTASAYISDVTDSHERTKGMALIGVAFGLGFVFGPAIGGGLAALAPSLSADPNFKAQLSSFVVAGICFINFVFAYFKLKESKPVVISFSDVWKTKSQNIFKSSSQQPGRLKNIFQSLKIKTLGSLILIFFLVSFAMSSMEATLILYMGELFQWGIKEVSLGFLYIGVIMIFTQGFLVRRILPLWGERKVLMTGLILFTLGMGSIPFGTQLSFLAISMTLLSLGNGFINPAILGCVSLLTKSDQQGEKLGLTQSLSSLGRILGPAAGGFVYAHWMIQAPFYLSAGFSVVGILIALRVFAEIPTAAKQSATSQKPSALFGIGFFQFQNLIQNKIPFTLVSLDLQMKPLFKAEHQHHLESISLAVSAAGRTADQIAAEIKKNLLQKNKNLDQSLVLISQLQSPADQVALRLEQMGFINVYYILGGYEDLLKDT